MKLALLNLGDYDTTIKNSYCAEVLRAFEPHVKHQYVYCWGGNETISKEKMTIFAGSYWYWIKNFIKHRKEIDRIHAQDLFVGGLIAAILSVLFRKPLTARCGGVWRYDVRGPLTLLKEALARVLEKIVLARARTIVFNSEHNRKHYAKYWYKSYTVYNGVDTETFTPKPRKKRKKIRLLFVGRLAVEKGLRELCQALEGDERYELTIVGDGPLREELEKKYPWAEYRGRVPHDALAKINQEHDVCVLPSYSEGMPNVVLEGMSSGLPVLASDIPALQEMTSGEEAILFEPQSTEAIKKALDKLAEADLDAMGQAARIRSLESFDQETQRLKLFKRLHQPKAMIVWDYELQKGMDMSMSGLKEGKTGIQEYEQTELILKTCEEHAVPCVFAAIGWIAKPGDLPYHSQEQIKRIVEQGHELGSHSMGHENLAEISEEEIRKTMKESKDILEKVSGQEVRMFVPPHNMPYNLYGLSVYRRPGERTKLSRHSLWTILRIAKETGYGLYRIYDIRASKKPLVRWPYTKAGMRCVSLSFGAGFGADAKQAIRQAEKKGGIAVLNGHPQATLDDDPQNMKVFEALLRYINDKNIDVVLPKEIII